MSKSYPSEEVFNRIGRLLNLSLRQTQKSYIYLRCMVQSRDISNYEHFCLERFLLSKLTINILVSNGLTISTIFITSGFVLFLLCVVNTLSKLVVDVLIGDDGVSVASVFVVSWIVINSSVVRVPLELDIQYLKFVILTRHFIKQTW